MRAEFSVAGMPVEVEGTVSEVAQLLTALQNGSLQEVASNGKTDPHATEKVDAPEQGPEPPAPKTIAEHILELPEGKHTQGSIIDHFTGENQHVPSRVTDVEGNRRSNPVYSRWVRAVAQAREQIEHSTGRTFGSEKNGKKKLYWLEK